MSRYKYKGPDATLGKLGPVGHGSIVEIGDIEFAKLDGTQFEVVRQSEPVNVLAHGTIPYVPDVPGKTQKEGNKETTEAYRKANPPKTPAEKKRQDEADAAAEQAEKDEDARKKEEARKEEAARRSGPGAAK